MAKKFLEIKEEVKCPECNTAAVGFLDEIDEEWLDLHCHECGYKQAKFVRKEDVTILEED